MPHRSYDGTCHRANAERCARKVARLIPWCVCPYIVRSSEVEHMTEDEKVEQALEYLIENIQLEDIQHEKATPVGTYAPRPLGGAHPSKRAPKQTAEKPSFKRKYLATNVPLDTGGKSPQEAAVAVVQSEQRKLREMPICPEHGGGAVEIAHSPVSTSGGTQPTTHVDVYLYCPLCEGGE